MEPADLKPPIEIPIERLSEATLRSVLESYIVREGTDYGFTETSHEAKIESLKRKLAKKTAHLIFDPNTESITFLTSTQWGKTHVI